MTISSVRSLCWVWYLVMMCFTSGDMNESYPTQLPVSHCLQVVFPYVLKINFNKLVNIFIYWLHLKLIRWMKLEAWLSNSYLLAIYSCDNVFVFLNKWLQFITGHLWGFKIFYMASIDICLFWERALTKLTAVL